MELGLHPFMFSCDLIEEEFLSLEEAESQFVFILSGNRIAV